MGVRARVSRCSLQRRPRRDGEEAHLGVDWLRAPLVGPNWLSELAAVAPRDGDRPQRGSDRAGDHTQRARAAERYARRESEPPPRKSGGRASRRRERGGTIEAGARSASAAPQAAAP